MPIDQAAHQATNACQAHAVVITGSTFGESMEMIQAIKIGAGDGHSWRWQDPANVEALRLADGIMVGRSLKTHPT